MTLENKQLVLARKEYGYSNISGIGLDVTGRIILVDDFGALNIGPCTRVIENPPVEGALSAPIKVYFDPTYVCSLNCPMCLADVPTRRDKGIHVPSLLVQDVQSINKQIINAGVLQVKIGGGEPFLYAPFWSMLDQLGEAGIGLSTSTSGVTLCDERLLTKKQIGILAKRGVKVSLSVDGEHNFHNKRRGSPDLLENILDRGIPRLRNGGVEGAKIEYRATITNDTESIRQLGFLLNLAQNTQTIIRIRLARPCGSALKNGNAIVELNPEIAGLIKAIRSSYQDNDFINIDPFLNFDKPTEIKTGLDCGAGTRGAGIDANGDLSPCGFLTPFLPGKHNLLISNTNLLEVWQFGKAFVDVRGYFKKENESSPCVECVYIDACQGGCPSVRLSKGMSVNPLCPKDL